MTEAVASFMEEEVGCYVDGWLVGKCTDGNLQRQDAASEGGLGRPRRGHQRCPMDDYLTGRVKKRGPKAGSEE